MVGAALHRHPVPLPLPLLAGPWPGKMEPSAGHYVILHHEKHADVVITPSLVTLVSFTGRMISHFFQHRNLFNRNTVKYNAVESCFSK